MFSLYIFLLCFKFNSKKSKEDTFYMLNTHDLPGNCMKKKHI